MRTFPAFLYYAHISFAAISPAHQQHLRWFLLPLEFFQDLNQLIWRYWQGEQREGTAKAYLRGGTS